jgi:hypothetical protein
MFPVAEANDQRQQHQLVDEVEAEAEEHHPQHDARSYYDPGPRVFHAQNQSIDMLDKISKETLIIVFAAFFIGLLLGKSLTPVILKH